mmetsp:Transcript_7599/g.46843  ORF Transcript_7599/g.46843 Transcript_7599/m.46843 type:complete len:474 (+) Transcript_7599:44-1465(+)
MFSFLRAADSRSEDEDGSKDAYCAREVYFSGVRVEFTQGVQVEERDGALRIRTQGDQEECEIKITSVSGKNEGTEEENVEERPEQFKENVPPRTPALAEAGQEHLVSPRSMLERLWDLETPSPPKRRKVRQSRKSLLSVKREALDLPNDGLSLKWVAVQSASHKATPCARWGSAVVANPEEDKVFLSGGDSGDGILDELWQLDLKTMEWSMLTGAEARFPRAWHSLNRLGDRLLLFGGESTMEPNGATITHNDCVVHDGEANLWFPAYTSGVAPNARGGHTATALPNGNVVVFGGIQGNGKWANDIHVLDTRVYNWFKPPIRGAPPKTRSYHTATAIGDSKIVVFGGNGASKSFKEVYYLDTETWTWHEPETGGDVPHPRTGHAAVSTANGSHLVVWGGWETHPVSYFNDTYILDVHRWHWTKASVSHAPPRPRCGHSSCRVKTKDGHTALFIFGGQLEDGKTCHDIAMLQLD